MKISPVNRMVPAGLVRPTSKVVTYKYESSIPAWINKDEVIEDHGLSKDRYKGNMVDLLV